jgi:hypothetical protein
MRANDAMGKSRFSLSFADGSHFVLPDAWEQVFIAYYGADPAAYPALAEQLVYVVGKYIEHRAWPSKFDGICTETEGEDINQYDDPNFYFEHWDDLDTEKLMRGGRPLSVSPTWAEVAEAVLYQSMRAGLLQQALNTLANEQGMEAPRVVTPERFLEMLEQRREEEEDER